MAITHPLTSIEAAFWYQYKLEPQSNRNNLVHKIDYAHVIDEARLADALQAVCLRNPLLRSRFSEEDGKPKRCIHSGSGYSLRLVSGDDHSVYDAEIAAYIHAPFDLKHDALVRCLLRTDRAQDTSTLYIALPHIIFDDISWELFCGELTEAMNGHLPQQLKPLPPAPQDSANAQDFWQHELAEAPTRIALPTEKRAANTDISHSKLYTQVLPMSTTTHLARLAARVKVTPSVLYSCITATLMYKLSGQKDFILATPVTTRTPEHSDAIGAYINVLPCRYHIDSKIPFSPFAQAEGRKFWSYIAHRHFSLIELAKHAGQRRQIGASSLYNVMFEYVTEPALYMPGATSVTVLPNTHAKLDLTLTLTRQRNGKESLRFEYDNTVFDDATIRRIAHYYVKLAADIARSPDVPIGEYTVLTPKERKGMLALGKGGQKHIGHATLWQRFERVTRVHPYEAAISMNGCIVTYAQLRHRALWYAYALQQQGVVSGSLVAVYLPRSPEFIASMLAIWALGAIYLPLEVKHPAERILSVLALAQPAAVITNRSYAKCVQEQYTTYIPKDDVPAIQPLLSVHEAPNLQNVTYVIFTSGSTGAPKGVMITHVGFLNHLAMMIKEFDLKPGGRVAQTASVAFDISVWQLVCPLVVGGTVCIYDDDTVLDATAFYDRVHNDNVSVIEIVPSLLAAYLDAEEAYSELRGGLARLQVVTTGEAITPDLVRRWFTRYPGKTLLNAYGPAEASDDTHFHYITPDDALSDRPVPIGRPLINIKTYVLDADRQLCPVGVVGEIYIAGIAVAAGYLKDSERTKEAFMADPYTPKGGWMYKTGDYGCWRPSGVLDYRGRRDNQVKIYGQRIELGEIERQMMTHEALKEAVVIVHEQNGNKRLVAFVTAAVDINEVEMKTYLGKRLPAFMVPWRCIQMNGLPRNSSGKVDRRALAGHAVDPALSIHAPAPSGLASMIAQLWARELATDVGEHTNFFDAGGDSLLCARIVALLNKEGINVSIKDVLTHQTPAELASMASSSSAARRLLVHRAATELTPIQLDYLAHIETKAKDYGEVQAVLLEVSKEGTPQQLEKVLQKLVARHVALRRGLAGMSQVPVHRILQSGVAEATSTEDLRVLVVALQKRLHLEDGPLFVARLVRLQHDLRLLLVAHHFAVDLASWSILRGEIDSLLHGDDLKSKKDQDYLYWWRTEYTALQESRLASDEEEAYWRSIMRYVRPIESSIAKRSTQYNVSIAIRPDLEKQLQGASVALDSLVQCALALSYGKHMGQASFCYMVESTARAVDRNGQLSAAVGWLTYLYPRAIHMTVNEDNLARLRIIQAESKKVPHHGLRYGLYRHWQASTLLAEMAEPPWVINYVGHVLDSDRSIILKMPSFKKDPFVEIDVIVKDKKLELQCMHNTTGKTAAMVHQILQGAGSTCEQLIAQSLGKPVGSRQFDLATIDESRLTNILKRLYQTT